MEILKFSDIADYMRTRFNLIDSAIDSLKDWLLENRKCDEFVMCDPCLIYRSFVHDIAEDEKNGYCWTRMEKADSRVIVDLYVLLSSYGYGYGKTLKIDMEE